MNIAVILAGGIGSRLGLDKPKQFMKIAGKTVLEHTVETFQAHKSIDEIAIVVHGSYFNIVEDMVLKNHWTKVKKVLNGGSERYESSLVAINAYKEQKNLDKINIIFHDAVRPLVSERIIDSTVDALSKYDAVDVAIPAVDTIVKLNEYERSIESIPERKFIYRGQTPQGFKYNVIKRAYEKALQDANMRVTDDCGIVKKYLPGVEIFIVKGEEQNCKLTYPEDVYVLDKLFQMKHSYPEEKIDPKKLRDRVMIVFGGSGGIGLDIINVAQKYGTRCYAFSRSLTNTDIRDEKQVKKAMQQVYNIEGRIDYVVNTAAILNKEPIMHLDSCTINKIIDTNYKGMVNVTISAYPYIKKTRGQILLFTSSSYTRGRANYALYSSTKAAVVNFIQAISEEWQSDEIRINCINPQRTKTPMRVINFGNEPEESLLKSEDVAKISLRTLTSEFSGEVVDIKL